MKIRLVGTLVFALASFHLLVTAGHAQEEEAAGDEAAAAAVTDDKETPPLREQTIYVPFSKLRESFEKEGRGVFLPYEEFRKLWQAARDAEPRAIEQKPPVAALITEISSTATVEKDVLQVESTLTIEILKQGWHHVPLRLADAAISAATIDDEAARIVADAGGGYLLLVKKEGRQPEQLELALKYSKAYSKSPGQNSVSFQAPRAPVNRWNIRIPQAGVKVNVYPMIAAAEVPAAGAAEDDGAEDGAAPGENETVVQAFVGAAPTVRIDWTPKSEGAAGLAALATVQARQQSTVDEGVLRTRAQLLFDITRADVTQLRIDVPSDQKVAGVFDPNVRQWEVAEADDVQRVTVQLFQPTRGRQNISLELEKFSDEDVQETVAVPVIKALDVARQQGVVVVRLAEGLRADTAARAGLLQVDASELPPELAQGGWAFAFRYATVPFELKLAVEKIQPRIRADQLVEAYLEPERLAIDLLAVYNVERAGVFQLELEIPAGFELRQVRGRECSGAQAVAVDQYHRQDEDPSKLRVNLSRKALGKVGLLVQLTRRLDDANLLAPTGETSEIPLPLPRVAPESVEQLTGRLVVYKPESLRIDPGKQEGLRSISFDESFQEIPSTRDGRFPQTRPALAFAYTGEAVDLTLKAERRKPYITARQLLVAQVEPGEIKYEARFNASIRYSGVKSLRIDVPADLAAEIRNDTPAIREATMDPAPDDVADGYTAWSFTGETELLGNVVVKLSWEEKIDELEIGKSIRVNVPHLRPRDVDRTWGQIVVTKSETIDVRPAGTPEGLRPIDPQHDLRPEDRVEGAARAFEFQEDWSLALEATRYKLEEVKRTSIELAVVRQVVTRSNQIAVQALYRMRSARQRLAIKLPAAVDPQRDFDAQPARIGGVAVPLESGDSDELYVPLVGQNPDKPFLLELRYTLPGTAAVLQLPEFPEEPAVQKVYLCAYLPEDRALLGSRGPWTDQRPPWWEQLEYGPGGMQQSDRELIQNVLRNVAVAGGPAESFQTDGALYVFATLRPAPGADGALSLVTMDSDWFQGLSFAVVLLVGLALLARPAHEKFAVLAMLLIALILAGVFLPTFSQQILQSVMLWALSIVLIVWVVWFVVKDWPRRRAVAAAAVPAAQVVSAQPTTMPPTTMPPTTMPPASAPGDQPPKSPPDEASAPDRQQGDQPTGDEQRPDEGGPSNG